MPGLSGIFRLGASSSWQRAVTRAEKLVGYPTSFMSLRHLLSDEAAQVAVQLRKLVGTDHPLLKTARGLLGDQKRGTQTRGLVVLLLAKAAARPAVGILPQHRSLAEIVETIHTAALIHRGIVNCGPGATDMVFGNRLATLSGDFLLASASTGLADLNNTRVVEWVSASIADVVEAEFSPLAAAGDRLETQALSTTNDSLVAVCAGLDSENWEQYVGLSRGSLLAACARSAVLLAERPQEMQEAAGLFAHRWALLHSLVEELGVLGRQAENGDADGGSVTAEENYGLCPRPSLAHVLVAGRAAQFADVREEVLAQCWERADGLAGEAKAALRCGAFPDSDGLVALCRLVDSLVQC